MATVTTTIKTACKPYRLSVDQFMAMIDAGVFHPEDHVELLGGILVQQMTKGDPHNYTLSVVGRKLDRLMPEGWLCLQDKSLQLSRHARPEPDIAIVLGPAENYKKRTPHARETALVVEVSESSYAYDRGEKWRAYASAQIPIYWIVNLDKAQVEVYRDPAGRGKSASYRQSEVFDARTEVPVVIDGQDVGRVVVKDVLP